MKQVVSVPGTLSNTKEKTKVKYAQEIVAEKVLQSALYLLEDGLYFRRLSCHYSSSSEIANFCLANKCNIFNLMTYFLCYSSHLSPILFNLIKTSYAEKVKEHRMQELTDRYYHTVLTPQKVVFKASYVE